MNTNINFYLVSGAKAPGTCPELKAKDLLLVIEESPHTNLSIEDSYFQ